MSAKKAKDEHDDGGEREVVASDLDESTHAEMRLLYRESTDAILFAKAQQWKTVGATLVLYVVLVLAAEFLNVDRGFLSGLQAVILVASAAATLVLVFYQFWQYTEQEKLDGVGRRFSNLFRDTRKVKSRLEANVHRYTLLVFMIAVIFGGGAIAFFALSGLRG